MESRVLIGMTGKILMTGFSYQTFSLRCRQVITNSMHYEVQQ